MPDILRLIRLLALALPLFVAACKSGDPAVELPPGEDRIRAIVDSLLALAPPPPGAIPAVESVAPGLRDHYVRLREAVYLLIRVNEEGDVEGHGTAFAIERNNLLVTNHHVIEDAYELYILLDGTGWPVAEVLAWDEELDYAVLRMHPDFPGNTVLPVAARLPQIGEPCFAIGNPGNEFALVQTLTAGVISNYSEDYRVISSTADIAPGSSGGPLFNERGEVIGITTAYYPFAGMFNISGNIHNLPRRLFGSGLPEFIPPARSSPEQRIRQWLERFCEAVVHERVADLNASYAPMVRRHHDRFALQLSEAVQADTHRSWARETYMVSLEPDLRAMTIEALPEGWRITVPVVRLMLAPGGGHREYRETWEFELDPAYRAVSVQAW